MGGLVTSFDAAAQDALLAELHAKAVDGRLFLFVAHDLYPRAMGRRVQGFAQAQSSFQGLTPIRMGSRCAGRRRAFRASAPAPRPPRRPRARR